MTLNGHDSVQEAQIDARQLISIRLGSSYANIDRLNPQ